MVHLGSPGGARCVVWVKWWGCGLGWDTIAVVGAGLGRHFVMIDIFHISRICCKGTHYLRHYRKCASFFISHGLFLRRRGCFNTDFHGWGCEIYDGFPRICSGGSRARILRMIISHRSHRFHRFFYLTDCWRRSRILRMIISHRSHGFHGFFYLTDCWLRSRILRMIFLIAHRFHRFHGFFYLTDFAVFGAAVGYRSQISQISRIFLSHRLC